MRSETQQYKSGEFRTLNEARRVSKQKRQDSHKRIETSPAQEMHDQISMLQNQLRLQKQQQQIPIIRYESQGELEPPTALTNRDLVDHCISKEDQIAQHLTSAKDE